MPVPAEAHHSLADILRRERRIEADVEPEREEVGGQHGGLPFGVGDVGHVPVGGGPVGVDLRSVGRRAVIWSYILVGVVQLG